MKLAIIFLILALLAVPAIQAAELGDYEFYDNTVKLFSKISDSSLKMPKLLNAEKYETVKEMAEVLIVAIDVYNWKWDLYKLSPQAQLIAAEVEVTLKTYRAGMEDTVQSMDALQAGNTPLANEYIDKATIEISEAQPHIMKIIDLLP